MEHNSGEHVAVNCQRLYSNRQADNSIQIKISHTSVKRDSKMKLHYCVTEYTSPAWPGFLCCFCQTRFKGVLSSANLKLDHQELRQEFSLPLFFTGAFMAFHTILIPVRPLFQTGHFEEGPNWFMNWVMKTVKHLLWYIFFYLHFHKFSLNSILVHVVNTHTYTLTGHFISYTDTRLSKMWQNFHFLGKLCL